MPILASYWRSIIVLPLYAGVLVLAIVGYGRIRSLEQALARQESEQRAAAEEASEQPAAPAVPSLPHVTHGIDPYLQIPAVVHHPNAAFVKPYHALRKGLKVRYLGNLFSREQPELIWVPAEEDGKLLLKWQTSQNGGSGLQGIFPGNVLELLDDHLYDFGVGTLFVKVRSEAANCTGYALLETILGETEPADNQLWLARDLPRFLGCSVVRHEGLSLYAIVLPQDAAEIEHGIEALEHPEAYDKALSAGKPKLHPSYAANTVYTLLLHALTPECPPARQKRIVAAAQTFFAHYVFPRARATGADACAWPCECELTMNWGIKLVPPWYSAYTNALVAGSAALLHRATGKAEYRELAVRAANFIGRPIEQGGAESNIGGFRLPTDHVYATPPLPNVRVLDSQFVALTALYNAARLLGDSKMLQTFLRQGASLAMQLETYTCKDGTLYFAMYGEKLTGGSYWLMWSNLQAFANILKDRRLLEIARQLEPHIPTDWRERYGY